MKGMEADNIFSALFISALWAVLSAIISLLLDYVTLRGGIDYAFYEDKQSFFLTFVISNNRSESANIEIGISSPIDGIVASSGSAGIEILNPAGRVGNILSITKIPPMTDYNAIVRGSNVGTTPTPVLIQAPTGIALNRADPTRGRVNFLQIGAQTACYFIIYFGILVYYLRATRSHSKLLNDKIAEMDKHSNEIDNKLNNITLMARRTKGYMAATLRYYRTENDFWRLSIERLLISDGASRVMSRRLLAIIATKFGYKRQNEIEDKDLDFIIDAMIDEEKRGRFEQLGK